MGNQARQEDRRLLDWQKVIWAIEDDPDDWRKPGQALFQNVLVYSLRNAGIYEKSALVTLL